ncbi:MAG TPA: EAL domain-containing protein, partial [Telluria sp.]|nr:EAL domain-containing protein [Telluria sp.]
GEELLHASGIALARAKADGDSYAFFTHGMGQSLAEQIDLEAALRHALPNGEFTVYYQPRYTMDGRTLVGLEALLRWKHPRFGMVEPSRFIPLAERNGLIAEIGMWVLDCACAQMLDWERNGLTLVPVAVNLSARQFRQEGLDALIGQALARTGLHAPMLELEITESTLMHDTAAATQTLRALKRLGVTLSVDDFGTGYSCLSYLKLFPLDVLKIDRSFVLDVTHSANDAAIVRAIVGLAHSLDLRAVAEGVEDAEQQAFLQECGCDEVQGYHFGRPAPPEAIALLLARARQVAEGDPA